MTVSTGTAEVDKKETNEKGKRDEGIRKRRKAHAKE
jgi:hypothetical protein